MTHENVNCASVNQQQVNRGRCRVTGRDLELHKSHKKTTTQSCVFQWQICATLHLLCDVAVTGRWGGIEGIFFCKDWGENYSFNRGSSHCTCSDQPNQSCFHHLDLSTILLRITSLLELLLLSSLFTNWNFIHFKKCTTIECDVTSATGITRLKKKNQK